jgi:hypothetical protein
MNYNMEYHSFVLPSGKTIYYGCIRQFLGVKKAFFDSFSREDLLNQMFSSFKEDNVISPYYALNNKA